MVDYYYYYIAGQPSIVSGPEEVVVGMDSGGKSLKRSAMFKCTAIGLPAPEIQWLYKTISEEGVLNEARMLDPEQILNITESGPIRDDTGRFEKTSTVTISISQNDGGIIRCKTGSVYKDAHLTVLGNTCYVNVIVM